MIAIRSTGLTILTVSYATVLLLPLLILNLVGLVVVIVKTIYYRYALRVTLNNIDRGGVGLYPKLHSLRRRYNYGIKI